MTTFDDRERGEEAKFAFDAELEFRAKARRDKLMGLWVAEQLSLSGSEAEAYALSLVETDFDTDGNAKLIAKITEDFKKAEVDISEHRIHKTLAEKMSEARLQLQKEG